MIAGGSKRLLKLLIWGLVLVTFSFVASANLTKSNHPLLLSGSRTGGVIVVDGDNGSDRNYGSDWQHAKKTIQGAIDEAKLIHKKRDIYVKEGTYNENLVDTNDYPSVNIYGGYKYNSWNDTSGTTVIDGRGLGRVFTLGTNNHSTLRRLTLKNGTANGDGGILTGGSFTLEGATLQNGNATGKGGAVYGFVTVNNSTLIQDASAGSDGGCIYNPYVQSGQVGLNGLTLRRCTSGGDGGGAYLSASYTFSLRGLIVEDNSAANSGGGLYISSTAPSADWTDYITTSAFRRNHSLSNNSANGGGGVYLNNSIRLQLERNLFDANEAQNGSAMILSSNSNHSGIDYAPIIDHNIFINNVVRANGALLITNASSQHEYVLLNNTYANNNSQNGNSALYLSNSAIVDFYNELFVGNHGSKAAIGSDRASVFQQNEIWKSSGFWNNSPANFDNSSDLTHFDQTYSQDPKFLNTNLPHEALSYQLTADSSQGVIDGGYAVSIYGKTIYDFGGSKNTACVFAQGYCYDLGANEFQNIQENVTLNNFVGDLSTVLLHLTVFDSTGVTKYTDAKIPLGRFISGKGSYYVLPYQTEGYYLGQVHSKGTSYKVCLDGFDLTPAYAQTCQVVTMAADNMPGVSLILNKQ